MSSRTKAGLFDRSRRYALWYDAETPNKGYICHEEEKEQ
jgi:hypothetical protein